MRCFFGSFALLLLLGMPRLSVSAGDILKLDLVILCDKSTYLVGEPIWIDILLINKSGDSVKVYHPMPEGDYFRFNVVEGSKDTLAYGGLSAGFGEHPNFMLAPDDTIYNVYDLSYAYGYSAKSTKRHGVPLTGDVEVSATHCGCYHSNTLNIRIDDVTDIEKEPYNLLRKILEMRAKRTTEAKQYSRELLETYPTSVYAEAACYHMIRLGQGSTDLKQYVTLMLEQYSNSGYVVGSMMNYLSGLSQTERDAKLDSLQSLDVPFRLRMIARNFRRGFNFFAY